MIDRVWNDMMIPVSGNDKYTHVRALCYYSLGGMNLWNYKNEPRGYYLSVTPIKREVRNGYAMIACSPMDGIKRCVLEVSRKSAKWEAEAVLNAKKVLPDMLDIVCGRVGIDRDSVVVPA